MGSGAEDCSYARRVEASTVGCEKGWEMMSSHLEMMLWRSARRAAYGSLRRGLERGGQGPGGRDGDRAALPEVEWETAVW